MSKCWVYHKTEEPKIVDRDEAQACYDNGWADSPAKFIKTTDFDVDPDNEIQVQQLGEAIEGVKDMANDALNIKEMSAKELSEFALKNFKKKLKSKTKPTRLKEVEKLING